VFEGDVSSKAPLLDTLPFAIMVFLWGQLFLGGSLLASTDLIYPMLAIIVITPVLHRGFNLIGYASVRYVLPSYCISDEVETSMKDRSDDDNC
jgi:hypothetical protein